MWRIFWRDLNPAGWVEENQATTLTAQQRARLAEVFACLAAVDDTPLERVLADFSKDPNAEAEIQLMERVAALYIETAEARNLDEATRKSLYQLIMSFTYHDMRDWPAEDFRAEGIGAALAGELRDRFYQLKRPADA
jgi:hypothetical protein